MKFNTFALSGIASALILSSGSATADVTVYGKANISLQASEEGDGSFTELKSNASRLGFKGAYEINDDLTAIFKYELQVDIADESGEKNLKSRNQYVGLKGWFGEVLLGRNDTVFKQAQGKLDLFNDYEGDIKRLWKGENRMGDSITYKTVKFNNFQAGLTYLVEDSPEGKDGVSASLTYGDKYLKDTQLYVSAAIDSDVKGYDATRLVGHTKLSGIKVGLGWHTQEAVNGGEKQDGYLVNASYSEGKLTYKGQYQTLEDDGVFSFGGDYKLAKSTKLYAWFTQHDRDSSEDNDYLSIGLEHKF